MTPATARKVAKLTDRFASACLGAAVAFAVYRLFEPMTLQPALGTYAAGAAGIAYTASRRLLGRVSPRRGGFAVASLAVEAPCDALLHDEVIAAARPDSRVVQLFDPAAMPMSGQSTARIGRLANDLSPAAPPDASDALHEALNQLRRSLH